MPSERFAEAVIFRLSDALGKREQVIDGLTADVVMGEGGEKPLFLVSDVACAPPYVASLLRYIDVAMPVYRLAIAAESRLRTVQGMAACLLEVMRDIQPNGPYRIAGCVEVGLLAHELALQVAAADGEVRFLGLLETGPLCSACSSTRTYVGCADTPTAVLSGDWSCMTKLAEAVREYEIEPSPITVHWFSEMHPPEQVLSCAWAVMLRQRHLCVLAPPEGEVSSSNSVRADSFGHSLAQAVCTAECERPPLAEYRYVPLLTIQSGWHGAEPFFCIPGAGANVVDFIPFAEAIGEEHPVHGFQARGMDGELLPYSSVESAGRAYLKEIEHSCPRGGVHLVGHSFGGWIAFEIALRLQVSGREVRSLTLLDSEVPPGGSRLGLEYTQPEALMELIGLYEEAAGKSLGLRINDFEGLSRKAQLRLLHSQLVRIGLMPTRSEPEHLRGTLRTFEAALRTRYCPSAIFNGVLRLVLVAGVGETSEQTDKRIREIAANWGAFAERLEVCREAGNHITLLKKPHIASVANWIRSDIVVPYQHGNAIGRSPMVLRASLGQ